jgi:cytochrome P450
MMPSTRAPGPRGLPLSGNLWNLATDPLAFLQGLEARYGGLCQARIGHLRYHLVSDPDLLEQVLWRRSETYLRDSRAGDLLRDITGTSLLTTTGPEWLQRRKRIAPAFNRERMVALMPAIHAVAERHEARWAEEQDRTGQVDVGRGLARLTCAVAGQVLVGHHVEDPALEQDLEAVLAHHWRRLCDPTGVMHRLPTAGRRAFDRGNRRIADLMARLVAAPAPGSLLATLAATGPEEGLRLADELTTLLIAGHETTASALAWALYLLAEHPAEQERLRQAGDDPGPAMRVFQEALRLYPPIWILERRCVAADTLGGYTIPAEAQVLVSPWVVHRSPRWWENPAEFCPDRFLAPPRPHTFLPFGLGPHACVGAQLALVEGPLLLTRMAARWRWTRVPRTRVAPRPGLTLRMGNSLRLRMTPL